MQEIGDIHYTHSLCATVCTRRSAGGLGEIVAWACRDHRAVDIQLEGAHEVALIVSIARLWVRSLL